MICTWNWATSSFHRSSENYSEREAWTRRHSRRCIALWATTTAFKGSISRSTGVMTLKRFIAREGATLNNLSQIYKARGDYETALKYLEQSLQIQREIGDKAG